MSIINLLGLTDPITKGVSSARLTGLSLAAAAIVFAFTHPENHITLVELLAASALALGLRTRSDQ